jgi:hypothetical protein
VAIDRPYDDNLDAHPRVDEPVHVRYETRDRATYYEELRAAVAAENWSSTITEFRSSWASYTRDHPPRESESARESPDGSWIGSGDRHLDRQSNADVDRGCDRIRETEETIITPAMRRIESEDPTRHLVGLDHRLKGSDRIKEKVAKAILERGTAPEDALSKVPDAIRYTFQYSEQSYSSSVTADIGRLTSQGFEITRLKNSWSSDDYRGINSQWRDPGTGQRFEIQFHTERSFEAKQVTHDVYERLRDPTTTDSEASQLHEIQRLVTTRVPVPEFASEISRNSQEIH